MTPRCYRIDTRARPDVNLSKGVRPCIPVRSISLTHPHVFLGLEHDRNERRTWFVVGLTFSMMVAEIVGGSLFGSLALIADGWHMSTHAAALTISAMAYRYARRHATDRRFAFGTGKLGDLAGYTSAVVLGMIALLIAYQSLDRLLHPVSIAYGEAVAIATLGLAVNLISAWLLRDEHHHHDHDVNGHHGHDRDLNLRSAYIHVLADAALRFWRSPACRLLGGWAGASSTR